jgi:hypothetical protein
MELTPGSESGSACIFAVGSTTITAQLIIFHPEASMATVAIGASELLDKGKQRPARLRKAFGAQCSPAKTTGGRSERVKLV